MGNWETRELFLQKNWNILNIPGVTPRVFGVVTLRSCATQSHKYTRICHDTKVARTA